MIVRTPLKAITASLLLTLVGAGASLAAQSGPVQDHVSVILCGAELSLDAG